MAKTLPQPDIGQPLQFDPDFNGPLKRRSCTDILCLLIFVAFVGCWIGIGAYAIINGNPSTLLVPRDSSGRRCGLDHGVIDRPYLFFFDLMKCLNPSTPFTGCPTEQVCVKSCPSENFFVNMSRPEIALPYCKEFHLGEYDSEKCPIWFLSSESIEKRCVPSLTSYMNQSLIEEISKWEDASQSSQSFMTKLKTAVNNVKLIAETQEVAEQIVADILTSWWKLLIGVGLALLVCIIYILLLRWIAAPMVWISILGVLAALSAGIYFTSVQYVKFRDLYNDNEDMASYKTKRDLWLTGLIVLSIALGIVTLMLIFLRKRIMLAIALIKEGSRAVSSVTSSLFFPVFPWVFQVGVIAYAVCVGLYLATTGQPVYKAKDVSSQCESTGLTANKSICHPENFSSEVVSNPACKDATCKFMYMENESIYYYLQAINVFGFFWLAFFVSAMGQMVLAQVFAQWYWTFKKTNLPFFAITAAWYRTLRYHIGTLAFGSLIIAICRMIRVCLEYIDHKLKKYDNEITRAILCCMKCFFWCLEKFLKFVNKNAYIMCAIHGKNFCASARDAFSLLMRNIIRVFVLDKVTDFLFFLSKLLVTVGVGSVAYVCFATDLVSFIDNSSLNYGVVPVVIIMVATYLISTLFFSVYSMAVDTLFLCFLEDCERNDGSREKPYYMSKNLMTIFGKKNHIKYD